LHDWASHGADSFRYGVMGGNEAATIETLPKRNFKAV